MSTLLYLLQGATERRTWALDGTLDLTGATARLAAVAGSATVLDVALQVSAETRLLELVIPPATSSAWSLPSWGLARDDMDGATVIRGYRADYQIELTLANGDVHRVDEGRMLVSPELVR